MNGVRWDDIKYFKREEFECSCCEVEAMRAHVVIAVDEIRRQVRKPLVVTSGYRCAHHPAEADKPKDKRGQHTLGLAVDIAVSSGAEAYQIVEHGIKRGATGIGIRRKKDGKDFVHLDWRATTAPVIWTY